MQSVALANIHQSKVSNVENIRSIYAYKDPEQMKDYEQKKLVKEQTKSDEKLEEPMALFRVFVNNDRFYTDDNKYKDNVELAITSHNIDRNYIFDNEYPPYLILQDNDNNRYEIHFAKVKYDNPALGVRGSVNADIIQQSLVCTHKNAPLLVFDSMIRFSVAIYKRVQQGNSDRSIAATKTPSARCVRLTVFCLRECLTLVFGGRL